MQYYYKLTASEAFDKRMNLIDSLKDRPEKLLSGPTYCIWHRPTYQIPVFLTTVWIIMLPRRFLSIFQIKILCGFQQRPNES